MTGVVVVWWYAFREVGRSLLKGHPPAHLLLAELRPHPDRLSVDEARRLPAFRSVSELQAERRAVVELRLAGRAAPRSFLKDPQDLRGIPVVGCSVGGVSPGTSPGSDASLDRCDRELERRRAA